MELRGRSERLDPHELGRSHGASGGSSCKEEGQRGKEQKGAGQRGRGREEMEREGTNYDLYWARSMFTDLIKIAHHAMPEVLSLLQ